MSNPEHEAFYKGITHGKNSVLADLLDKTDKKAVIHALFAKAHNLADQETDPIKKRELEAYSEGFRHTLNILNSLGNALEAYHGITNPSLSIPLTEQDVRMLS